MLDIIENDLTNEGRLRVYSHLATGLNELHGDDHRLDPKLNQCVEELDRALGKANLDEGSPQLRHLQGVRNLCLRLLVGREDLARKEILHGTSLYPPIRPIVYSFLKTDLGYVPLAAANSRGYSRGFVTNSASCEDYTPVRLRAKITQGLLRVTKSDVSERDGLRALLLLIMRRELPLSWLEDWNKKRESKGKMHRAALSYKHRRHWLEGPTLDPSDIDQVIDGIGEYLGELRLAGSSNDGIELWIDQVAGTRASSNVTGNWYDIGLAPYLNMPVLRLSNGFDGDGDASALSPWSQVEVECGLHRWGIFRIGRGSCRYISEAGFEDLTTMLSRFYMKTPYVRPEPILESLLAKMLEVYQSGKLQNYPYVKDFRGFLRWLSRVVKQEEDCDGDLNYSSGPLEEWEVPDVMDCIAYNIDEVVNVGGSPVTVIGDCEYIGGCSADESVGNAAVRLALKLNEYSRILTREDEEASCSWLHAESRGSKVLVAPWGVSYLENAKGGGVLYRYLVDEWGQMLGYCTHPQYLMEKERIEKRKRYVRHRSIAYPLLAAGIVILEKCNLISKYDSYFSGNQADGTGLPPGLHYVLNYFKELRKCEGFQHTRLSILAGAVEASLRFETLGWYSGLSSPFVYSSDTGVFSIDNEGRIKNLTTEGEHVRPIQGILVTDVDIESDGPWKQKVLALHGILEPSGENATVSHNGIVQPELSMADLRKLGFGIDTEGRLVLGAMRNTGKMSTSAGGVVHIHWTQECLTSVKKDKEVPDYKAKS